MKEEFTTTLMSESLNLMNKSIFMVVPIIFSFGCAANSELVASTAAGNLELRRMEASRYLLDASIPTPLGVMTVKVANPQSTPQVSISDPGADAVKEVAGLGRDVVKTAGTVLGLKYGGEAAVNLIGAAAGVVADVANNKTDPTIVNSYNDTDNSDNSDNTNNGVKDSEVARFQSDNLTDNTHTPTVVEQPTPIVVRPEVVRPEVVTQP